VSKHDRAEVSGTDGRLPRGGTPAIVELDRAGHAFAVHEFDHDPSERGGYGLAAAAALGVEADRVFKTLLADVVDQRGVTIQVVGIVPVTMQLSLKELAGAVGGKRAEMCDPVVAQRITGYVVGGISPFGQKKRLPTSIDETCLLWDTIFVSGGKRGLDLELAPDVLVAHLDAIVADIAVPGRGG
jgi:Cys-tRNA(Pro)/Cys-tRNA(Cys) deacylase